MPSVAGDYYNAHNLSPKGHYAYQPVFAKSPSPSAMTSLSRELPMPVVTRIVNLAQAQATLQHCLTRLSQACHGLPLSANERRNFQPWLDRWEEAFTAYLSVYMPSMKTEEITCCRTLKANHLACTILAADPSSASLESDAQAIVELAAVIIKARRQAGLNTSTVIGAMDVENPLRVVAARCDRPKLRAQANELLSIISGR